MERVPAAIAALCMVAASAANAEQLKSEFWPGLDVVKVVPNGYEEVGGPHAIHKENGQIFKVYGGQFLVEGMLTGHDFVAKKIDE